MSRRKIWRLWTGDHFSQAQLGTGDMISIHMGDICLLKAKPLDEASSEQPLWQDLVHFVKIRPDLRLAALLSDPEISALKDAREMWLDISGEAIIRRLRLVFVEDGEAAGAFLIDERDSLFDIHDVSVADLIARPG